MLIRSELYFVPKKNMKTETTTVKVVVFDFVKKLFTNVLQSCFYLVCYVKWQ